MMKISLIFMRNILFLFHDFKLYYLNHIIKQKTDGGILRSFRSGRRDWNRLWNSAEKNLSAIVRRSEWRKKVLKKSFLFLRIQTKPLRSYHLAYGNILKMKCGRKFKT